MSILRNMLEKDMTLKGLSYYKKCWNLEVENAKVVQGSSHGVAGLTEILLKWNAKISDNNNTLFNLLGLLIKFLVKYLYTLFYI